MAMRAAARRCRCARSPASPILFVGTGEKSEALEPFDPDRMARRILGMGDVVSLVEDVRAQRRRRAGREAGEEDGQRQGVRLQRPASASCSSCMKMGGMAQMLDKLPGGAAMAAQAAGGQGDKELKRQIALIDSMTPRERRRPKSSTDRAAAASQQGRACRSRTSTAC